MLATDTYYGQNVKSRCQAVLYKLNLGFDITVDVAWSGTAARLRYNRQYAEVKSGVHLITSWLFGKQTNRAFWNRVWTEDNTKWGDATIRIGTPHPPWEINGSSNIELPNKSMLEIHQASRWKGIIVKSLGPKFTLVYNRLVYQSVPLENVPFYF